MEENIVEMKKWHDTMRKFIFGAVINDSIVMKDMHPGYFYLKGYDDERNLGFYAQYVVDKDVIYTYEMCYPKNMENRMQRLMDLIHNWNPEPRR